MAAERRIALLVVVATLTLAGCAGGGTRLSSWGAGDARLELTQTAFFPDDRGDAGAAALATLLYTDGVGVDPQRVARVLRPASGRDGQLAALAAAAVPFGRFAVPLDGRAQSLIAEVRAGHPVLVQMNLGSKARPYWRDAVLVGYEPSSNTLMFRSGREGRAHLTPDQFLPRWAEAGHLALVVSDGHRLPATVTLARWISASEVAIHRGRPDLAIAAAETARARWADALLPWVALGNAQFAAADYDAAQQTFLKALAIRDDNPVVHNNLARVLLARHCADLAREEVGKALAMETNPILRQAYARTQAAINRYTGPEVFCPPLGADAQAPIQYDVLPLNPETPRASPARRSRRAR